MAAKVVHILLCVLIWGLPACLAIPPPLPGQIVRTNMDTVNQNHTDTMNMMKTMDPINQYYTDAMIPPKPEGNFTLPGNSEEFKYKWLQYGGNCSDERFIPEMVEIAGTQLLPEFHFQVGCDIVGHLTRNMPEEFFNQFAQKGSVGLFTSIDKVTIFPEFSHARDRPECEGTCADACSDTCTGDGRKVDSLAGLAGSRATCLNDNFMCTDDDPYGWGLNVLVHEVAHTIHMYGLPASLRDKIYDAYDNAYKKQIWNIPSYSMSNQWEYFAEGTSVYFNVDHYQGSGMNSCCRPSHQYCETEDDARQWLSIKDPLLYECLKLVWSNNNDSLPGDMTICPGNDQDDLDQQ